MSINWVQSRSECCTAKIFSDLSFAVKTDVDARKNLGYEGASFDADTSDSRIMVTRTIRSSSVQTVEFTRGFNEITVKSTNLRNGPIDFSAKFRLNSEGRCVFVVESRELESWQLRQEALEELFFGPF